MKLISVTPQEAALIIEKAAQMRMHQVEYFATKSPQSLINSKEAESALDQMLFGFRLTKRKLEEMKNANDTIPGRREIESTEV